MHKRHKPQANVHYVGTPRQVDVDEDEDKGISVYDFYTSGKVEETLHRLAIPPRRIIEISTEALETYKVPKGVKVELRVRGSFEDVRTAMGSAVVKRLHRLDIIVKSSPVPEELTIERAQEYERFQRLSRVEVLRDLLREDTDTLAVLDDLLS